MTGFDTAVLIVIGVAAIGGLLRGLVQEILSLAAWMLSAVCIYYLHHPLSEAIKGYINSDLGTFIVAFGVLLVLPYAAMKVIAKNAGQASRESVLGPIDRVLGFGFGAVKGAVITVFAFSVLALGYDSLWGYDERPDWMTGARTYPLIDASSREMVFTLTERRHSLSNAEEASSSAGPGPGP